MLAFLLVLRLPQLLLGGDSFDLSLGVFEDLLSVRFQLQFKLALAFVQRHLQLANLPVLELDLLRLKGLFASRFQPVVHQFVLHFAQLALAAFELFLDLVPFSFQVLLVQLELILFTFEYLLIPL